MACSGDSSGPCRSPSGCANGAAHRALDAFEQADRRHGLDHRRADAGEMRQLRGRQRRPILQLLEHAAARVGQFQRRVVASTRARRDRRSRSWAPRAPTARSSPCAAPRRAAPACRPRPSRRSGAAHRPSAGPAASRSISRSFGGRDLARALAPHHAHGLALAQRHDHEVTGGNLQALRHAVIVGVGQRQRQQHADGALDVFHRFRPRRRRPLGLWLRGGIARNCGSRRVRTTGHWGSLYEVLRRYRRRRRDQGSRGLGSARRGDHQPLADHEGRPADAGRDQGDLRHRPRPGQRRDRGDRPQEDARGRQEARQARQERRREGAADAGRPEDLQGRCPRKARW